MEFKKAKLKLGKGKKAANNATDTSFKARCAKMIYSMDNSDLYLV